MKITEKINHPIAHFFYGCIWFSIGIIYWQTQLIDGLGILGIFITGSHLLIGFFLIMPNYSYVYDSSLRKQYKIEQLELKKQRDEFNKIMSGKK